PVRASDRARHMCQTRLTMTSIGRACWVSYSTGMSPGMAPRTLIVCLLAVGVSITPWSSQVARAEPARRAAPLRFSEAQDAVTRHPVAVIDMANDQAVRDVANLLLEVLASHPDLAPPAISDGAALVDKLPTDDEARLEVAKRKLVSA